MVALLGSLGLVALPLAVPVSPVWATTVAPLVMLPLAVVVELALVVARPLVAWAEMAATVSQTLLLALL